MATRKSARKAPARAASPLVDIVTAALDDMKAVNVKTLDVRGLTDIADTMIVASGTSDRHVRSIADRVIQRAKESGHRPYGVEGERDGEWVLVDLNDVVLHVMLPRVREFYGLEQLWEAPAPVVRPVEPVTSAPPAKSGAARGAARRPAAGKTASARTPRRPARSKPTR
jgi:ribosome-associated protein